MTIDEARAYLTDLFKPEYHRYIKTTLAGDFAVTLAENFTKLEGSLNEAIATDAPQG